MGYLVEKSCGCWFLKKGLIRHLFFREFLHFEAFKAIWLSKVNGPALLKEGGRRVVIFSPQKFVCTIEYHPNNYTIEDLGHSWGTSLKHCLGAGFLIRF